MSFMKSTAHALTRDNVVVAKGSAKEMRRMRKAKVKSEPGAKWTVWFSMMSEVGETLR